MRFFIAPLSALLLSLLQAAAALPTAQFGGGASALGGLANMGMKAGMSELPAPASNILESLARSGLGAIGLRDASSDA